MRAVHEEWSPETARAILSSIEDPGPVLIALQALQDTFGYVHADAVSLVANAFNVSRADVYGVLTFYSDLRTTAPADVEVRVCMGEACQAVGARALRTQADALIDPFCDVQSVFCVGNCALGPSAVVNGRILGRVTGAALAAAVSNERSDA